SEVAMLLITAYENSKVNVSIPSSTVLELEHVRWIFAARDFPGRLQVEPVWKEEYSCPILFVYLMGADLTTFGVLVVVAEWKRIPEDGTPDSHDEFPLQRNRNIRHP
ncbi:hypothetical protein MKW98_026194, partial [Papaver atlanticum]